MPERDEFTLARGQGSLLLHLAESVSADALFAAAVEEWRRAASPTIGDAFTLMVWQWQTYIRSLQQS